MRQTAFLKPGGLIATIVLALWQALAPASLFTAPLKPGSARVYSVEKEGSVIKFVVKSRLKTIEGAFEDWKAQIELNPDRLEGLQLALQAKASSIKTGNLLEESLLRGENFFAAEKHPEVSLAGKRVTVEAAGRIRMDAELQLRGVTRAVVIPFQLDLASTDRVQMRGEFEFSRKDFGMSFNMTLNPIEDLVKVILTLNLREQGKEGKGSLPEAVKN